jgi:predicted nucleic-acid-binding Zn-ribbon protein
MKLARLSVFLALPLMLCGCANFELDTFKTLAASDAVINQAQKDYISGTIKQTTCTYTLINDAKAGQTAAVTALEVYATEKLAGDDLTAQTAALTGDIATVAATVIEVKALYSNPTGCKI